MVRVLLLLDESADFEAQRSAEQLARGLGAGFDAQIQHIGRGGTYSHLADAILRLKRTAGKPDIIHAFGMNALTAAAIGGASAKVVLTPRATVRRSALRWLRAIIEYRDVQVICATSTQRRACVERGAPIERCHLARPGVDFARVQRRRSPELREKLGFGPDDRVILAA